MGHKAPNKPPVGMKPVIPPPPPPPRCATSRVYVIGSHFVLDEATANELAGDQESEVMTAFRELLDGIENSRRSICGASEIYTPQISVKVVRRGREILKRATE